MPLLSAAIQSKEDKREYVINITKEGLAILKVMDKILKQQKEDFNNLSDTEAAHLNALLNKIRS